MIIFLKLGEDFKINRIADLKFRNKSNETTVLFTIIYSDCFYFTPNCTHLLNDDCGAWLLADGGRLQGIGGHVNGSVPTAASWPAAILRLDVEVLLLLVPLLALEGSPASGVRGTDGGLAARTGHHVMQIQ